MLLAAISDTHLPRGSRRLPDECTRRVAAADLVLHAGDLTSVGFLEELRALGPPVEAISGNMDETALRSLLPEERIVEVEGVRIGMIHDAGRSAGRETRLTARFPGCAAVVYGHSHLPQMTQWEGVWILNPGSPTERRRAPARTMLELRVSARGIAPRLIELAG